MAYSRCFEIRKVNKWLNVRIQHSMNFLPVQVFLPPPGVTVLGITPVTKGTGHLPLYHGWAGQGRSSQVTQICRIKFRISTRTMEEPCDSLQLKWLIFLCPREHLAPFTPQQLSNSSHLHLNCRLVFTPILSSIQMGKRFYERSMTYQPGKSTWVAKSSDREDHI